MAVTSRVLAAQVKMDYEAAERAVEESGLARHEQGAHRRSRDLARRGKGDGRGARSGRGPRGPKAAAVDPDLTSRDSIPTRTIARAPGQAPRQAPDPAELATAIVDALTRYPGLTCERIAEVVQSPTALVKPHLAALIASGRLRKVGRARGTRYHLA